MTKTQKILKSRREEFEVVLQGNTSLFFYITRYSYSHYLLRIGCGITKWFMSEQSATEWVVKYGHDNDF